MKPRMMGRLVRHLLAMTGALLLLAGAFAGRTDAGTPATTSSMTPLSVVGDRLVARGEPSASGPCGAASEPVVATHPSDPATIAVAYQRFSPRDCIPAPGIRITHDGGRSWAEVPRQPWAGSGRGPGLHAAIAWGPGPRSGSSRLYWTDTTTTGTDGLRIGVAWSDDEGATWSRLYVERRTPPWTGGFPDITVDRDPASPGFGTVWVSYDWLGVAGRGPGLHVLASSDFGNTWHDAEVPAVPGPAGFGIPWRIDSRIAAGPDGAAYVAFYQADLRAWGSGRIWSLGPWGNVGRVGFGVARLILDPTTGTVHVGRPVLATTERPNSQTAYGAAAPGTAAILVDPVWSFSLDVDRSSGTVLLAVGDYQPPVSATAPRGTVRVGRSVDAGRTWRWTTVPAMSPVGGRPQSSFRPQLVAGDGLVFIGLRGIADGVASPTIGVAGSVSVDGGRTFSRPVSLSPVRWPATAVAAATNGMGLRERAAATADGRVFYAWSDGRLAVAVPGDVVVFGSLLGVRPT